MVRGSRFRSISHFSLARGNQNPQFPPSRNNPNNLGGRPLSFHSGAIGTSGTLSATSDTPGIYSYRWGIHGGMIGTIVVTSPTQSSSTARGGSPPLAHLVDPAAQVGRALIDFNVYLDMI